MFVLWNNLKIYLVEVSLQICFFWNYLCLISLRSIEINWWNICLLNISFTSGISLLISSSGVIISFLRNIISTKYLAKFLSHGISAWNSNIYCWKYKFGIYIYLRQLCGIHLCGIYVSTPIALFGGLKYKISLSLRGRWSGGRNVRSIV